jgi:DNA repair protein RecO (recombination protein O)
MTRARPSVRRSDGSRKRPSTGQSVRTPSLHLHPHDLKRPPFVTSEKAEAIVLRVIPFSETSSIVTLFTREFGKLGGLAKGARRPKGPFESALDLLARCRVVFLPKSPEALNLLTEAKLLRRFRPPGRDLNSLYAAYYVAELLTEMTDQRDPHGELFDAADTTLVELAAGGNVPEAVMWFELTALRVLGHLPSLDRCVECGNAVAPEGRIPFGLIAGGVMCRKCRQGKKQVVAVSASVIRAMNRFANQSTLPDTNEPVDRRTLGELRAIMNQYMSHLLGHRLRLHEYLGTWGGR